MKPSVLIFTSVPHELQGVEEAAASESGLLAQTGSTSLPSVVYQRELKLAWSPLPTPMIKSSPRSCTRWHLQG